MVRLLLSNFFFFFFFIFSEIKYPPIESNGVRLQRREQVYIRSPTSQCSGLHAWTMGSWRHASVIKQRVVQLAILQFGAANRSISAVYSRAIHCKQRVSWKRDFRACHRWICSALREENDVGRERQRPGMFGILRSEKYDLNLPLLCNLI